MSLWNHMFKMILRIYKNSKEVCFLWNQVTVFLPPSHFFFLPLSPFLHILYLGYEISLSEVWELCENQAKMESLFILLKKAFFIGHK